MHEDSILVPCVLWFEKMCVYSGINLFGHSLPASCELRVASCELRVASCELRVASCELRVASCELRVASNYGRAPVRVKYSVHAHTIAYAHKFGKFKPAFSLRGSV